MFGQNSAGTGVGVQHNRRIETESVPRSLESAIAREFGINEKIVVELHTVIERLEVKLRPVSLPSPPVGSAGDTAVPTAPTEVARGLQNCNAATNHAVQRLHTLLDSIDL